MMIGMPRNRLDTRRFAKRPNSQPFVAPVYCHRHAIHPDTLILKLTTRIDRVVRFRPDFKL
jgi:hypothetical protein